MANTNIYDITDEWTDSGTDYDGIKLDVTDTDSSATSYLMRMLKNSTNVLSLRKDGLLSLAGLMLITAVSATDVPLTVKGYTGQSAALQEWKDSTGTRLSAINSSGELIVPALRSVNDTNYSYLKIISGFGVQTGFIFSGYNAPATPVINLYMESSGEWTFRFRNTGTLSWCDNNNAVTGTRDLILARDAADTLALRRSTNAQKFSIYKTYTDASNYERLGIYADAFNFNIVAEKAGTGSLRALVLSGNEVYFQSGASVRWYVNTNGHFIANTDSTYDIGASGATRPRNVYVAGTLFVGTGGAQVSSAGANVITLATSAGTAMISASAATGQINLADYRITIGGTTSSYPALKRSTTQIHVKLADDSAFTELLFKLPTSDPGVSGVLWNNGGTVAISA